jgi:hypothetical protein
MVLKFVSALCGAFALSLVLAAPGVRAQDAMGGSMMAADPMATECLMKAQAETDHDKMTMMVEDCHKMYPDDMAASCLAEAMMEPDMARMEMMVHECHEAHPETAMAGEMPKAM